MTTEEEILWLAALQITNGYRRVKPLAHRRGHYAAIMPLVTHDALIVAEIGDSTGYYDRWCFSPRAKADVAFDEWEGEGEPKGWHRHPMSGRRRTDGDPEQEYHAW
jgi:hypothetical protein